jgi:DNA-binding IclR family transcriptional regulator
MKPVAGRKEVLLDDWIFGSADKRPILEALLAEPYQAFTPSELARVAEAELRQKNRQQDDLTISRTTVRKPLAALTQIGMLSHDHGRYRVEPRTPTGDQLALLLPPLLKVLERVEHEEVRKLRDLLLGTD